MDATAVASSEKNILLGLSLAGEMTSCELYSHALTFAAPRTGKGACQIIPTLRDYWRGNVICVDPKGEAVTESAKHREEMGDRVVCIDPVPDPDSGAYCSPDRYRVRFNPLDLVRERGAGYRDLMALADGLVLSGDYRGDSFFDDASRTIIAGALAYIQETAPPEDRHLGSLRRVLRDMNDPGERKNLFAVMKGCSKYGELAREAVSYMEREGGKSDSIFTTAAKEVNWLADEDMVDALSASDFDMNDLRREKLSMFLVLPPDALEIHGRFLRLFVRCALAVMKRGQVDQGESTNRSCLFVLDEFAKLGRIDVIAEDAGVMPGYGVFLWPIVHGIGQLERVYGRENAETFQGSATVVTAFGLGSDDRTAEMVSKKCGIFTSADFEKDWMRLARRLEFHQKVKDSETEEGWIQTDPYAHEKVRRQGGLFRMFDEPISDDYATKMEMDALRARIGRARFPADEVKKMTARDPKTKVAKRMFAFRDGDFEVLIPSPYFNPAKRSLDDVMAFVDSKTRIIEPYEADAFRRPQLYALKRAALKNIWNVIIVAVLVVMAILGLILQSLGITN